MLLPVSLLALSRAIPNILAMSAPVGGLLPAHRADPDVVLIILLEVLLGRGHHLSISALPETGNLHRIELDSGCQGSVLGGIGLRGIETEESTVVVVLDTVLKVHAVLTPHRFGLLCLEVVLNKELHIKVGEHCAEGLVELIVKTGESDRLGVAGDTGKESLVLVGKVGALVGPCCFEAGKIVTDLVSLFLGFGSEGGLTGFSESGDLGGNSATYLGTHFLKTSLW